MIDLMKIARTEADGGDLFGELQNLFEAKPQSLVLQRVACQELGHLLDRQEQARRLDLGLPLDQEALLQPQSLSS